MIFIYYSGFYLLMHLYIVTILNFMIYTKILILSINITLFIKIMGLTYPPENQYEIAGNT